MLITINLLPTIKKNERQTKRFNSKIFTICFMIALIMIGLSFLLYSYSAAINIEASSINDELTRATAKTKTYSKTEESLKKLSNTITFIDGLETNSLNFDEFIQKFSNIIPEKIQINTINITTLPEKTIEISGKAESRREAILFLEKMKNTPFLKDPLLKSLEKAGDEKSNSFTISLSAKIIPGKK